MSPLTRSARAFAERLARDEGGQALVEFGLMLPVILALVAALMGGAWLMFTYEAVANGASSGARAAIVETSLIGGAGDCESGLPVPIQAAVQHGANIVAVNPAPLCQSGTDPTELVQSPQEAGAANVALWCVPGLAPGQCQTITVTVTYAFYLPPPFSTAHIRIAATSTQSDVGALRPGRGSARS